MGAVGGNLSDAFDQDNAQIGVMIGLFMAPGLFLAAPAGFSGRFASDSAILFRAALFALVLPAAVQFRLLRARAIAPPLQERT